MNDADFEYLVPKRNRETENKHKKEVLWQITIPLVIGLLLVTAACVLPVIAVINQGEVGVFRDVSLIWLIAPNLILLIIPLVLIAGSAYGVIWLIKTAPEYFFKAQNIMRTVQIRVETISDKISQPIIKINSLVARLQGLNELRKPRREQG